MSSERPASPRAAASLLSRAFVISLALLLAPLLTAAAQAEGRPPDGAGGPAQVRLSEDQVTGFIESFPRLRALGDKYEAREESAADDRNPASALAGMLKNEAAMREMNEVLRDHGFADFSEWAQVAYSIMIAHHWKGGEKGPAAQLDKAVEQIRANRQIGEEQKAALISRIEAQRGMIALFTPDPENVALVARYREAIDQAAGWGRPGQ